VSSCIERDSRTAGRDSFPFLRFQMLVKSSKSRRLSPRSRRAMVAAKYEPRHNLRRLARDAHVSERTLQRDVKRMKQSIPARCRPRRGRPPKLTAEVRARIRVKMRAKVKPSVRHLRKQLEAEHLSLSLGTIDRALHKCGFRNVRPQPKPMLTTVHKQKRLAWATAHLNDTREELERRVYSDEKLFISGRRSRRVWIKITDPIPHRPTSK